MTDPQMKYAIVITKIQFVSAITISTCKNDTADFIPQTEKSCCVYKVKVEDPIPNNSTSTQIMTQNVRINPTKLPNFIRNNPTVEQIISNTPETVEAAQILFSLKETLKEVVKKIFQLLKNSRFLSFIHYPRFSLLNQPLPFHSI
jgi:hypothetical protein